MAGLSRRITFAMLVVTSCLWGPMTTLATGTAHDVASPPAVAAASPPAVAPATLPPAPYAAGVRDDTVTVGSRSFSARIHYPAVPGSGGPDAPIAPGRFPAIVFGHGYQASVELYDSTLGDLASRGFIVVAPRSGGELFPDHAQFAADFSLTLDWLEAQDRMTGSWLFGTIEEGMYGASGHSMGGGVSLLAAERDPRFDTVAVLAAAPTNPDLVPGLAELAVPVLFVSGSQDGIAPFATDQRPMIEALTTGTVKVVLIEGGWHCGFLDSDPFLGLGCDSGSVDRATQLAITRRALADWFGVDLGQP